MAKSIEEILGKSINSTKELKQAIKELQDQLVSASQGTEEWTETADKLTAAQAKLSEVMNAGKSGIDAVEDSIVGMERRYKELYNTYKLLSDEQRNSPFGSEMRMELEKLSNELNETKKGVGNFKDNIGRYAQDAAAAFGQMGIGIGGLAGPINLANGGFKTLNATMMANPVFWLIAALKILIGIFNKVKEAIASNEESQMRLNQAMAAFQPIIDATANYFDKLGQRVVTAIEWISQAYTKIREISAAVTDFLGITDGEKKRIQEQNKLYADLAKRTNELTKAKREQTKLNASQQAEVKTLLDQAAGTADATEKMNLLNEAKRIQQEITERNIAIAQEDYDVLLEKSKLTANDAEMNDKLAEAEANVARARAEGAEKTKEMTSQILGLSKANDGYLEALKKEKEELDNLLKTIEENSKTELQKLEEKYKKEKALLEKYGKDTAKLTEQYAKERGRLEAEAEEEARAQAQKEIEDAQKAKLENFNWAVLETQKSFLDAKIKIMEDEKLSEEAKIQAIMLLDENLANYEFEMLKKKAEDEKLSDEERYNAKVEYYAKLKELSDEELEAEEEKEIKLKELKEKSKELDLVKIDSSIMLLDAMDALSSAISENIERTMEDEEQTEDSVKKKKKALKTLQDIQMAVGIAAIAADTAAGIMSIWRGYAAEKAVNVQGAAAAGPAAPAVLAGLEAKSLASAILQTASLGMMGAAQMAALISGTISNKKAIDGDSSGGGSAGTIAAPEVIETTPYSYTRQIQTTEEEDALNRPIWVSVTDIESGLNHAQVVQSESTW